MTDFIIYAEIIITILQAISVGILIYNQGVPRVRFLIMLSVIISIFSLGHILELSALDVNQTVAAYKLSFCAMPFIGTFYLTFANEYRGKSLLPKAVFWCLLALNFVFFISVLCYPYLQFILSDVKLLNESDIIIGQYTKGPLFYPYILYFYIQIFAAIALFFRDIYERNSSNKRSAYIIITCTLIAALGHLFNLLGMAPNYDFNPIMITFSDIVLIWFILTYRAPEWSAVGRHNAVENMHDAFILINQDKRLIDINIKATECFPMLNKENIGKSISDIPDFPNYILDIGTYDFTLDVPPNGKRHFMLIRSPLRGENGKKMGMNILLVDDTINYDITEVLRHQSRHDALTMLYNRHAFFENAGGGWQLAVRAARNACICLIDIDWFKRINETYGHSVGDDVLREVASLLKKRLRITDIGSRYGGEEFIIWIPETNIKGAFCVAEELRKLIEKYTFKSDTNEEFKITISIGISELKSSFIVAKSFEKMVELADDAVVYAKHNGRNRTAVCIPNDNGVNQFITSLQQLDFFMPMLNKRTIPDDYFNEEKEQKHLRQKAEITLDELMKTKTKTQPKTEKDLNDDLED